MHRIFLKVWLDLVLLSVCRTVSWHAWSAIRRSTPFSASSRSDHRVLPACGSGAGKRDRPRLG
jgi:hypothetical protein